MSKYRDRGAYHYAAFNKQRDPYRLHVIDLVEALQSVLSPGSVILEVGCGEGLIMNKLKESGCYPVGCDTDPYAVDLGKWHGNLIRLGTVHDFAGSHFNAVLFLDSLEHITDWKDALKVGAGMLERKEILAVALPDREDKHAVNDPDEIWKHVTEMRFDPVHQSTRHARRVMILRKP